MVKGNKYLTVSQNMYNRLAPFYREYSIGRSRYIKAVDRILRQELTSKRRSLLDLGTGDGERIKNALKGHLHKFNKIYLVENSSNMIKQIKTVPPMEIINKDFSAKNFSLKEKFDCVTCLWNVLGHIPEKNVLTALTNIKEHLSPTGVAIIDINNRQNIKQYGWRAVRNFIKDTFCYKFRNGNIDFLLDVHNNKVPASVHLFSKKEFETLLEKSGLAIQYCHFINYQNGHIEKNSFAGQLCYVLRAKI